MRQSKPFIGRKFGRLTVLRELTPADTFLCRCACGNEVSLYRRQLTERVVIHCGCRYRTSNGAPYRLLTADMVVKLHQELGTMKAVMERLSCSRMSVYLWLERAKSGNVANRHDIPLKYKYQRDVYEDKTLVNRFLTGERISYTQMKARCLNKRHHAYADYGGRGIQVCARWLEPNGQGFRNFLDDMGPRPLGKTLDRKDVEGNYEPGNCRWADAKDQTMNRRNMLSPGGDLPSLEPSPANPGNERGDRPTMLCASVPGPTCSEALRGSV